MDTDSHAGRAGAARRRQLFVEATALLEERCSEDLSLEEVARELATSSRQLQRAFAENGEPGFRAYLTQLRMQRAAELLRKDRTPIDRVGQLVAYRGAGAFSKAFRRTYGVSPTEFRREVPRSGSDAPSSDETGWTTASGVLVRNNGISGSSNTGGANGSERYDGGLRLARAHGRW